jgi:hypothetical protein
MSKTRVAYRQCWLTRGSGDLGRSRRELGRDVPADGHPRKVSGLRRIEAKAIRTA